MPSKYTDKHTMHTFTTSRIQPWLPHFPSFVPEILICFALRSHCRWFLVSIDIEVKRRSKLHGGQAMYVLARNQPSYSPGSSAAWLCILMCTRQTTCRGFLLNCNYFNSIWRSYFLCLNLITWELQFKNLNGAICKFFRVNDSWLSFLIHNDRGQVLIRETFSRKTVSEYAVNANDRRHQR